MELIELYNSLSPYQKLLIKETIANGYLNEDYSPIEEKIYHIGMLGLIPADKIIKAIERRISFLGIGFHITKDLEFLLSKIEERCSVQSDI